ncbi:MAG TPA: hypothetical protein VNU68_22285 [Verrucomicrobiae bacterium]|nr:hypothetical protein [Verrucomicrobiae bacterium]
MKALLSVVLGLGAFLSSSLAAQLAIYNFTSSHDIVGNGSYIKSRSTGVLIIDLEGDRAARISKFRGDGFRLFAVADEPNFKRWRALRPKGATTMTVSRYVTGTNGVSRQGVTFASGKDESLNIGRQTSSLPKSLVETGYTLIDVGGEYVNGMSTINSTHTFSAKQTIAANTQNETLEQVVERLRQALNAEGYSEITPN